MRDLISREDAIKHIKAYRDEFKEDFGIDSEDGDDASHHFGYIAGLNRATRIIEDLPSAKPPPETCWGCNCPKMEEPKKGQWVRKEKKLDLCTSWWFQCSECGKQLISPTLKDEFRYCPECGAKMEVSE